MYPREAVGSAPAIAALKPARVTRAVGSPAAAQPIATRERVWKSLKRFPPTSALTIHILSLIVAPFFTEQVTALSPCVKGWC